jgi:tetratricopeptide (TPR) repeat protein
MTDNLFDALATADDTTFARLCEENAQWLSDNWAEWSRVPPELLDRMRTDPAALQERGRLVFRVARQLDLIGHRGPMDHMRGSAGQSPIVRFENTLREASARAENGEHEACKALLLQAIERLAGNAGVEPLYVRGHVELALCCARLGDLRAAVDHASKARDFERKAGRVYVPASGPLLEALTVALAADPSVVALRDAIAHAQRLSDLGEFAASNAELERLTDSGAYAGKVYGLMGLNHFRLGDLPAARAWTTRALTECERTADHAGMTIYRTNLRAINRPG